MRIIRHSFDTVAVRVVVFLSCFVLSFVVGSFVIVPEGSKAVTGLGLVGSATMTLAAGSNSVALSPVPNVNDGMASGLQVLTANTNVPSGYSLVEYAGAGY